MTILWWPAVVAGVSGTLAMILAMELLRRAGWTRRRWSSMLGALSASGQERWGVLIHFLDGAIAGAAYAVAFWAFDLQPGFWVGVVAGIVHGGLALLACDVLRRRARGGAAAGPFDPLEGNLGRLAIAVGFVVHGVVTAMVYAYLARQGTLAGAIVLLSGLTLLALGVVLWLARRERLAPSFTASSPEPRRERPKGP